MFVLMVDKEFLSGVETYEHCKVDAVMLFHTREDAETAKVWWDSVSDLNPEVVEVTITTK